jgi:hypothetical protein
MATVTPNFNWPVPTSTDLVKDGATAIEALGDSIDASLVDLKGGTTGQVLAKASGTDMDFSWVAQDDSNAIQNTIVDAKGDLIGATAADTPARLAVGTNGQVLTADSTAATGLAWATVSSTPTAQGVAVYNSTDQSIASGSYTTATFNSEYFDTDAFHSTATNTGRLTVPASMAGEYAIVTNIYVSPTAGGDLVAKLQINGSDKNRFVTKLNSGEAVSVAFTSLVTLAVADYVEVLVYQNTGSNQNLSTNQYGLFGMYRIGA